MESYREQAIQLPGIGKGAGIPGNAMNTEVLTDYCLQEKKKERKKHVTFFKLLCTFRDRHKTISFEKTACTKIKKNPTGIIQCTQEIQETGTAGFKFKICPQFEP